MVLIIGIILVALLFVLLFMMGVGNLKTPYEQKQEDEAQEEFLKKMVAKKCKIGV